MMQKGKKQFIANWGFRRFLYAYMMLMLRRFLGFRISAIRAKAIALSQSSTFEEDGLLFRTLTINDFENKDLNNQLDITKKFVAERLKRGDQCVGALCDGKVIGYSWRTILPVEIDGPIWMSYGDRLYYHYKGFVSPDYRGKGLYTKVKKVREIEQFKIGRTHLFGCIETHNYPSLIASDKNSEKTIGYSAYINNRLGFWSWHSRGIKAWDVKVYSCSD